MMPRQVHIIRLLFLGGVWACLCLNPAWVFSEEIKAEKVQGDQLLNRIDFGNSYIMGQSIKSGAVYLMHRKKSEIKSMLKSREDYREEILEGLKINTSESNLERVVTEKNNYK